MRFQIRVYGITNLRYEDPSFAYGGPNLRGVEVPISVYGLTNLCMRLKLGCREIQI